MTERKVSGDTPVKPEHDNNKKKPWHDSSKKDTCRDSNEKISVVMI